MPGSTQIAVTPQRVADGDPAALVRLVDRRARAVLGFCETVCTYDVAPLAAAEAFARFRAAVYAASDPRSLDPETLLHGATRHAAGAMARSASSETRRRLGRRGDEHLRCVPTPGLLAARADNMLGVAEDERLTEHLQRCAGCRAVEARFARAEQAYLRRASGEIDPMTFLSILEALHDAAPVDPRYVDDWDEVLAAWAKQAGVEELPAGFEDELTHTAHEVAGDGFAEDAATHDNGYVFEDEDAYGDDVEDHVAHGYEHAPADEDEPVGRVVALSATQQRLRGTAATLGSAASALQTRASATWTRVSGTLSGSHGQNLPRPFRHAPHEVADHGPVYRYVLPGTAVLVAALIILAVAGVFSAGGG